MRPFQALIEKFQVVLNEAAKERGTRRDDAIDTTTGQKEVAWILFEREQMHAAVTVERAKLGKGPVPIADVKRVESMAAGHSDYGHKFALYCAELVLKEETAAELKEAHS